MSDHNLTPVFCSCNVCRPKTETALTETRHVEESFHLRPSNSSRTHATELRLSANWHNLEGKDVDDHGALCDSEFILLKLLY